MKKWLDDLYSILLKRGFNTFDNVLKKYKTEIEDYEEIKLNDELITLNPGESVSFDLLSYYYTYDRFIFFNRGYDDFNSIVKYVYKYADDKVFAYYTLNTYGSVTFTLVNDRFMTVKNNSSSVKQYDFFVKKIC